MAKLVSQSVPACFLKRLTHLSVYSTTFLTCGEKASILSSMMPRYSGSFSESTTFPQSRLLAPFLPKCMPDERLNRPFWDGSSALREIAGDIHILEYSKEFPENPRVLSSVVMYLPDAVGVRSGVKEYGG